MRPTQSELGEYDPGALFEFSKMHIVEYHAAVGSSCLVEADEEPPHDVSPGALETALIFSLALHSKVMDEIHVMRKIVIDGSNTRVFSARCLSHLADIWTLQEDEWEFKASVLKKMQLN